MTREPMHIVFAGGGTGGHLFPGLAVAERLAVEMPQVRISFAGSGRPLERREVTAAGFEYVVLPCRPLPRRPAEALSFVVENLAGYLAASRFLDEHHIAAVVGLGGYVSVPMARAAARRGVPVILLEQNAIPGRATRWLAGSASVVCAGMARTRANLRSRCPVRVTGTPIRPTAAASPRRQIVVLGGSQGARVINQHVPRALYKIGTRLAGWQIVHQSGASELESTRQLYRKLGIEATIAGFIELMPEVLAGSSLAVCRAGGTTLAELAAAGVPAILLPYPRATDDHQGQNAEVFTNAGAALTLDERSLPGRLDDHLAVTVARLLDDTRQRAAMAAAMRRLAWPRATAEVAAIVIEHAQHRHCDTGRAAA